MLNPPLHYHIRDAREDDIPALVVIKGTGSEAVHRDRLREAQGPSFRYLVLLVDEELIGFACLVMRRPASWSDAADDSCLPQIVDLQVLESRRGQGHGTAFLQAIEQVAAQSGFRQVFLSVEPRDNPRAYALYLLLGYAPIQPEPYRKTWQFLDSEGRLHHGEDWVVDMVKEIGA